MRRQRAAVASCWIPAVWSLLLALLLLGPALAPGYVLSYDMVWVPDLALRADFLGLGSGLPRAVPSDALVSVVDELVPGMLLQKLVLLGSLVSAGAGGAALVRGRSTAARCLAASLFVWNPFVVERLVLGHWPVLVGYAVLPWLLLAARRHRQDARSPAALWWLLPLGCLSASAGIASALAVLVVGLSRRGRRNVVLLVAVLAANAPWLVAGLLHASDATSDPVGAEVFALRGEGSLPAPLTALGLGGVWNAEVVPASREGILGVVALVVVLALALAGARSWLATRPGRDGIALGVLWAVGWGLAVLGWAAPGLMTWLAGVPGGGVLRDGSRLLGLCVPLVAVLVAHGADRLAGLLRERPLRLAVGGLLALVPLALMPDAAWGSAGDLRAVDYPASYAAARDAVGDADGAEVLLLPFSSYRAPVWNGGRKVLDPLGRYVRPDYVASDDLFVSGVQVTGEDPRGDEVRRALAEDSPEGRAAALDRLGIGVVLVDSSAPGAAPDIAGGEVLRAGELTVLALPHPQHRSSPAAWRVAMALAWGTWLCCWGLGCWRLARRMSNRRL
jgi:hypothetical protein